MSASLQDKSARQIERYRIDWQGIEIEIRFERNWLSMPASDYSTAHFDIEAIAPERAELPITETGYRSHFTSPESVDNAGGPVAFVKAALDEAAKDKRWKTRQAGRRQLSLF